MAISLQQVQRQSQQLIMTPQMQQSIQLLQMNTLELEQLADQELMENPFLEIEEDGESAASTEAEIKQVEGPDLGEDFLAPVEREFHEQNDDGAFGTAGSEGGAEVGNAETSLLESPTLDERPEHFEEVDLNWDDYYDDSDGRASIREQDEEERDFSEYTASKVSLYEHLTWQLRLSVLDGIELEIGEYLIGCINEDGYLEPGSVEEAAEKFATDPARVERALSIIQEFEPPGIAARNSAECLSIQMKILGSYTPLAGAVLEGHFEDLERKRFKVIAKAVGAEEDQILAIYQKVSRLEPKPGRAYTTDSAQYIEPDVVVKLIDGKLSIYVNEGQSSRLSVNRMYRQMLRLQAGALTREDKAYATEKFRGALMLIKNIEKRKSTILRVTESIMEVQREFLDKGVEALKPLTLREIADMVGMHESTIARVTSKKFVETPQGLFSLKFFFSSGIESLTGEGDAVSSRAIKDKLADLISKENGRQPLSDQKIAEILNKQGFQIARRTVAKYREQLKILPAKLRRDA